MSQNYMLVLFVTLEQERAIHELFTIRGWKYKRKSLETYDLHSEDDRAVNEEITEISQDPSVIMHEKSQLSFPNRELCVKCSLNTRGDIQLKPAVNAKTDIEVTLIEYTPRNFVDDKCDANMLHSSNKINSSVLLNSTEQTVNTNESSKNSKTKQAEKFNDGLSPGDTYDILRSNNFNVNAGSTKSGTLQTSNKPTDDNETMETSSVPTKYDKSPISSIRTRSKSSNFKLKTEESQLLGHSICESKDNQSDKREETENITDICESQLVSVKLSDGSKSPVKERKYKKRVRLKPQKVRAREVDELLKSLEENFPDDVRIEVHESLNSNGTRNLKCMYCTRIFSTKFNFIVHIDKHLKQAFDCTDCGKRFSNPKALKIHRFTRANLTKFTCEYCTFEATTACLFRIHNRSEHQCTNTFQCHICPKILNTKSYLNVHLKQEHGIGEDNYECEICGFKCKSERGLKKHLQGHKTDNDLKCQVCGKEFLTKKLLRSHMVYHSERKHECNQCGKRFTTITKLRGHERTHTGIKPYACTLCDYRAALPANLRTHMKMHQRDGYSWPKCRNSSGKLKPDGEVKPLSNNEAEIPYESNNQNPDWYIESYNDQNVVYGNTAAQVYTDSVAYQSTKTDSHNISVIAKSCNSSFNKAGVTMFGNNTNDKQENPQLQNNYYNQGVGQSREEYPMLYNALESYPDYVNPYMNGNEYYSSTGTAYSGQADPEAERTAKQSVASSDTNMEIYSATKMSQIYVKQTSNTLSQQQQQQQQQQINHQHHYVNTQQDSVIPPEQHQPQQQGQPQTSVGHDMYAQGTLSGITEKQGILSEKEKQVQSHHHHQQQQHYQNQAYTQQVNQQVTYQPQSYDQHYPHPVSLIKVYQNSASSNPSQQQVMYDSQVYTGMGKHLNEIRPNLDSTYSTEDSKNYAAKTTKTDFTNPNDRIYLGPQDMHESYKYVYQLDQQLNYDKQASQEGYNLDTQTTFGDLEETFYAAKKEKLKE